MNALYIILLWSVLGVPVYQYCVLRPWRDTHPHEIWGSDVLKSLPCGLVVMFASFIIVSSFLKSVRWNK